MKTTGSIFTKIGLGLLVATSIAACNNKSKDTGATTPENTTIATSPSSLNKETIVYVNSDTLFSKYNYAKDVNKKLNDKGNAAQSELTSKGQAFQREVADYQKQQASLPADQRQATEQRLQRKQQELQQYQQRTSAEFQDEKAAEVDKLYDKIADFTKQFAKEKGYKLVLSYSKANSTVLYGDAGLDVTNELLKRLNDDYASNKK